MPKPNSTRVGLYGGVPDGVRLLPGYVNSLPSYALASPTRSPNWVQVLNLLGHQSEFHWNMDSVCVWDVHGARSPCAP